MRKSFIILSTIVFLMTVDMFFFISRIHTQVNYSQEATDAIILLAPRKHTIAACAKLMQQNYAPITLVATTQVRGKDYFLNFLQKNNFAQEQFLFNSELSLQTSDLAAIIGKMVTHNNLSSVRIVADSAQIDRAIVELKNDLPLNVAIVNHPVINIYATYSYLIREYFKLRIEQILSIFSMEELVFFSYDK